MVCLLCGFLYKLIVIKQQRVSDPPSLMTHAFSLGYILPPCNSEISKILSFEPNPSSLGREEQGSLRDVLSAETHSRAGVPSSAVSHVSLSSESVRQLHPVQIHQISAFVIKRGCQCSSSACPLAIFTQGFSI